LDRGDFNRKDPERSKNKKNKKRGNASEGAKKIISLGFLSPSRVDRFPNVRIAIS
jgi:hypothetical protein